MLIKYTKILYFLRILWILKLFLKKFLNAALKFIKFSLHKRYGKLPPSLTFFCKFLKFERKKTKSCSKVKVVKYT